MLHDIVPIVAPAELGAIHFIGVGGVSMSGIARLLRERGHAVSGCDREDGPAISGLRRSGVEVLIGHDVAHLAGVDTVVYNSAHTAANSAELEAARQSGMRMMHRSAALASLMVGKNGIGVSGSHGKTTVTGMVIDALVSLDPSYMVGSTLATSGVGAKDGTGDWFIVEADESDGTFLQYDCKIVVVTSIESDHLDNWGTPERYATGFRAFVARPGVENVVCCADDPGARALADELRELGRSVLTYGMAEDADVRLTNLGHEGLASTADIWLDGIGGPLELRVPGDYNLVNAAAAYAVGRLVGLDDPTLRKALGRFGGTARRFQPVGVARGVRVIDDYAHHPTEVAAALAAARTAVGDGRVIACFQPHLFSRTRDFAEDFGRALAAADEVVVFDVYPAREEPIPGVTGELIVQAASRHGASVHWVPALDDGPAAVAPLVHAGDLVLTIGAGSVTTLGPRIVDALHA